MWIRFEPSARWAGLLLPSRVWAVARRQKPARLLVLPLFAQVCNRGKKLYSHASSSVRHPSGRSPADTR
eukprot:502108-Amphidinium_carterae.1